GERAMLDLADEFRARAFAVDPQPAVGGRYLELVRRERSDEYDLLRVLADVDEAAGSGEAWPELRDVEVSLAVGLRESEERDVAPAAVVEVELVRLVDDRLRVGGRAEVEAARGNAADDARLGGERDEVQDLLLVRHARDALRHADAEVHDAVRAE